MIFKPFASFLLLGGIALSFSGVAQDNESNIPVVTDEDELREITDTYRGNPDREKDFIPQGDGTVIDKRTGLQWMRCTLGQTWTGKTCEGKPYKYTLKQAMKERSNFAGYSDWRLPTIWELETLVYCSSGKFNPRAKKGKDLNSCKGDYQTPTIVTSAFPNVEPRYSPYWSSSPSSYYDDYSWVISFYYGDGYTNYKAYAHYVLLVRGGQ